MRVGIVSDYKNSPQFGNVNIQKGGIKILRCIEQAIGKECYTNLITKACDIDVAEIAIGKNSSDMPYITVKNLKNSNEAPIDCISLFKKSATPLVDAFKSAVNKAQEIADKINAKNTVTNIKGERPSVPDGKQIISNNGIHILPDFRNINTPQELYELSQRIIKKGSVINERKYLAHGEMGNDYRRELNNYKYLVSGEDGKFYYISYDWEVNPYKYIDCIYRYHISPKVTLLQMKDAGREYMPVAKCESTIFADKGGGNTKHLITNTTYDSDGLIKYAENLVDGTVVGMHNFDQSLHNYYRIYHCHIDEKKENKLLNNIMKVFDDTYHKKIIHDRLIGEDFYKFKGIKTYFSEFYNLEEDSVKKMIYENQPYVPKWYESLVSVYLDKDDKLKYLVAREGSKYNSLIRRLVSFDDNNNIKSCKMLAFCNEQYGILNDKSFGVVIDLGIKMPNLLTKEIPVIRPFVVEDFYSNGSVIKTKIYNDIEGKSVLYEGSFNPDLAPTSKTRLYYLPNAFISPVTPDKYLNKYLPYAKNLPPTGDMHCVTDTLWPCNNWFVIK